MKFLADLHIHSKYSLATSRNLDLKHLYIAARMKGIAVLGTGDFTHPGWFLELKENLIPAEKGLYVLKKNISNECERVIPESCKGLVRFLLSCEVSNIFKKEGRVRKIHSIILIPDVNSVEKLNIKLSKWGKTESNGRPIFKFDVRNLCEMILEVSDKATLIPAHIWTPWYSLFGSKSGFDSIEECFGDFSEDIFAAETGLSSDPTMCRKISGLDKITLISNSDAHSPLTIGREANIFNTSLCYDSIISAIKRNKPEEFPGTIEYYPEAGKYYADGHRNCNRFQLPAETDKYSSICPICGRKITIGVLHRILELSEKTENKTATTSCFKTIPLLEILSEIYQLNPGSKKIKKSYNNLLENNGPELYILNFIDINELRNSGIPLLAEAIERMRKNEVRISPGFDGKYGSVKILREEEIKKTAVNKKRGS
ncbi:MAG: endonuclease Q family protein [Proteobacteria bacterium]|nr:endonuclease Q family protein [Pseudomonadota bacterium]